MIPVREFVRLGKEAEKAFKANDVQAIARINARLADANAFVFMNEGKVYLGNLKNLSAAFGSPHLPFEKTALKDAQLLDSEVE